MKIMIADDEKWVRTTIKSIIPFEKLGMELLCEASNGIEALELCRSSMPDVLLTDIMMPGLSGLDLIKELKGSSSKLKIAIISGYSDFEYAKAAMKYGISDYLLKPIDESELLQVLEKFRRELMEEARQNETKLIEKEQYRRAMPLVFEAFLNQAVTQNSGFTSDKIRNELIKYGINFPAQLFNISVISIDSLHIFYRKEASEYYRNIVKRVMKRVFKAVSFTTPENTLSVISIINHDGRVNEQFQAAFRLISKIVFKRFKVTLSAGMSQATRQLGMLPQLYVQAGKSLELRFFKGPGVVHQYSEINLTEEMPVQLTEDLMNKIVLNLKLSNSQTAVTFINHVCSKLAENGNVKPELVREFFWQLIQSIISILNIQIPFVSQQTMITGEHPYDRIRSALFLSQLEGYTRDMLECILDFYHDRNPIDNANLVESAKRVIEGSYSGDISLEQVARHIHISPTYLSELFKKETGMSFIDYKTIVRIENAKKLLNSTALNIYEVSSKVGYSDPKYFSKLFKRITGKTVFQFRKEQNK